MASARKRQKIYPSFIVLDGLDKENVQENNRTSYKETSSGENKSLLRKTLVFNAQPAERKSKIFEIKLETKATVELKGVTEEETSFPRESVECTVIQTKRSLPILIATRPRLVRQVTPILDESNASSHENIKVSSKVQSGMESPNLHRNRNDQTVRNELDKKKDLQLESPLESRNKTYRKEAPNSSDGAEVIANNVQLFSPNKSFSHGRTGAEASKNTTKVKATKRISKEKDLAVSQDGKALKDGQETVFPKRKLTKKSSKGPNSAMESPNRQAENKKLKVHHESTVAYPKPLLAKEPVKRRFVRTKEEKKPTVVDAGSDEAGGTSDEIGETETVPKTQRLKKQLSKGKDRKEDHQDISKLNVSTKPKHINKISESRKVTPKRKKNAEERSKVYEQLRLSCATKQSIGIRPESVIKVRSLECAVPGSLKLRGSIRHTDKNISLAIKGRTRSRGSRNQNSQSQNTGSENKEDETLKKTGAIPKRAKTTKREYPKKNAELKMQSARKSVLATSPLAAKPDVRNSPEESATKPEEPNVSPINHEQIPEKTVNIKSDNVIAESDDTDSEQMKLGAFRKTGAIPKRSVIARKLNVSKVQEAVARSPARVNNQQFLNMSTPGRIQTNWKQTDKTKYGQLSETPKRPVNVEDLTLRLVIEAVREGGQKGCSVQAIKKFVKARRGTDLPKEQLKKTLEYGLLSKQLIRDGNAQITLIGSYKLPIGNQRAGGPRTSVGLPSRNTPLQKTFKSFSNSTSTPLYSGENVMNTTFVLSPITELTTEPGSAKPTRKLPTQLRRRSRSESGLPRKPKALSAAAAVRTKNLKTRAN